MTIRRNKPFQFISYKDKRLRVRIFNDCISEQKLRKMVSSLNTDKGSDIVEAHAYMRGDKLCFRLYERNSKGEYTAEEYPIQ